MKLKIHIKFGDAKRAFVYIFIKGCAGVELIHGELNKAKFRFTHKVIINVCCTTHGNMKKKN